MEGDTEEHGERRVGGAFSRHDCRTAMGETAWRGSVANVSQTPIDYGTGDKSRQRSITIGRRSLFARDEKNRSGNLTAFPPCSLTVASKSPRRPDDRVGGLPWQRTLLAPAVGAAAAAAAASVCPGVRPAFPPRIWRRTRSRTRSAGRCPAPPSSRGTRRRRGRPTGPRPRPGTGSTTRRPPWPCRRRAWRTPAPCWTASGWPATPADTAPTTGRAACTRARTAASAGTRPCNRRNRGRTRTCRTHSRVSSMSPENVCPRVWDTIGPFEWDGLCAGPSPAPVEINAFVTRPTVHTLYERRPKEALRHPETSPTYAGQLGTGNSDIIVGDDEKRGTCSP